MVKNTETPAKKLALEAAKLAAERHSENIVVLDLKGISPVADYFLIATGTSDQQMRSTCNEISELAESFGFELFGRAGYEHGRWILLDFVDVVVHFFDEEYREYYDLEMLWGDAKKLKIE